MTARFDENISQPPQPVDVEEFRASIRRINQAIKPTAGYMAAWAAIPVSIILGVILMVVATRVGKKSVETSMPATPGQPVEEIDTGNANLSAALIAVAVAAFAGSCVACCVIGAMRRKWPGKFFAAVTKENVEHWGSRVPSIQWRVDTHQHHTLHLRGSRSGFVSAHTTVQHTYDLHLDVAGGAPVAVEVVPAVYVQPQQLLQASWGQGQPQQYAPQKYPQQQQYPYQAQPQYGYGQQQQQHPIQMQQMAPHQQQQQNGAYYPPQGQYNNNYHPGAGHQQPPPSADQSHNLSDRLMSSSSQSDQ